MRATAQPLGMRCLCALLLVGFSAQTALASAHPSIPVPSGVVHEHPMDGDRREGHDPASCSFCRILSFFEHGLPVPSLCGALLADAPHAGLDALPAPRGKQSFDRPTSRAPPHSRIA